MFLILNSYQELDVFGHENEMRAREIATFDENSYKRKNQIFLEKNFLKNLKSFFQKNEKNADFSKILRFQTNI